MNGFLHLDRWIHSLGLLPFPLRSGEPHGPVVLLNGDRGNFCLDLDGTEPDRDTRDETWSSDVGHYVSVHEDAALVQRWNASPKSLEYVKLTHIEDDPERFHQRLVETSPPRSASVVAHGLAVFRQLRAAAGDEVSGTDALGAFLVLLAAVCEGQDDPVADLAGWELPLSGREVAGRIAAPDWYTLWRALAEPRAADRLQTHVGLLLRHAAGALFQEAHYLASFPWGDQLHLSGLPQPQVKIRKNTSFQGVHFTPAPIARALVELALESFQVPDSGRVTVLDPACGSGEFLREAERQLRANGFGGRIDLIGIDKSPGACHMARFLLGWEFGAAKSTEFRIECADALRRADVWPAVADLVLMNPPFVSWLDMDRSEQGVVRDVLGNLVSSRPDLASAFLWRSVEVLGARGTIGAVLPASTLDGTSYAALRGAISESFGLPFVARLGSHQVFPNATVDASLLVASRSVASRATTAVWIDHRSESSARALRALRKTKDARWLRDPVEGDGYSIYSVPTPTSAGSGWAPRPYRQWKLKEVLDDLPRVRDVFVVRQGVLTGRNDVFLLPRVELEALPQSEHPYFRPAVINGSVVGGALRSSTFVFYPYGESTIATEVKLRERVPEYFARYLLPHEDSLAKRQRKSEADWWLLAEYRAWQVKIRRKIVTTYFGDTGSFALDEEGRHVVVQGYAWLPRGALSRSVLLAYLAVLNSPIFSSLLAASSNAVSSGAWNLSKRFVDAIPVPRMADGDTVTETRDSLARIGQFIAAGGLSSLDRDDLAALDEYSRSAYGVETL